MAYLVAAMTAVTFVLSMVEPWTVSLRPREARADPQVALAAVHHPDWQHVELVVAARRPGQATVLPRTHLIVHPDGQLERTSLWASARSLPEKVMRVCAVYESMPSDAMLRAWLRACQDAGVADIRLKTMPQTSADPAQQHVLQDIHRRLSAMLKDRPAA